MARDEIDVVAALGLTWRLTLDEWDACKLLELLVELLDSGLEIVLVRVLERLVDAAVPPAAFLLAADAAGTGFASLPSWTMRPRSSSDEGLLMEPL